MRAKDGNNQGVNKMQKGQIFSLDFLISLVAVTAAIGLMIQAVELNTYNQREERAYNELESVAETTANLIVAGNKTTCTDQHLMNCIDPVKLQAEVSSLVPKEYGYEIELEGAPVMNRGAREDKDYYEVRRIVINNPSNPLGRTLKVKVWKNE